MKRGFALGAGWMAVVLALCGMFGALLHAEDPAVMAGDGGGRSIATGEDSTAAAAGARAGSETAAKGAADGAVRARVKDKVGSATRQATRATAERATEAADEGAPSFFERYLVVLGWMAGVLAVVAAVVLLTRKARVLGRALGGGNRHLEVLTRTAVGPKHSIAIVRAHSRLLLLGIGPESVATLADLSEPEAVVAATRGVSFDEKLRDAGDDEDLLRRSESNGVTAEALGPYRREIDRLKGMLSQWRSATGRSATAGAGGVPDGVPAPARVGATGEA